MTPGQVLTSVRQALLDHALVGGQPVQYAAEALNVERDPLQLAAHTFALSWREQVRRGRPRGRQSMVGTITVTMALPVQQHDQFSTQAAAIEAHRVISRVLVTQENVPGIHLQPDGLPEVARNQTKLSVRMPFRAHFTWSILED